MGWFKRKTHKPRKATPAKTQKAPGQHGSTAENQAYLLFWHAEMERRKKESH